MKRSLTTHLILFVSLTGLLLNACQASTPTPAPTSTPLPVPPTPAASPTPKPPESVTVFYEESAQFELISASGQRILIDIANPGALTSPVTAQDILLTTHAHSDHYIKSFVDAFPGQKLTFETGEIQLPEVTIRGIASAHNDSDTLEPKNGTNYIYIIDFGGLRIAHFGDIGQKTLSPEQLEALGQVDLALTQFNNSFSSMDIFNMKGFNLMDQVKPHLIIQTHSSLKATGEAVNKWKALAAESPSLKLTRETLPTETTIVFMGSLADDYQKIYKLEWFGKP